MSPTKKRNHQAMFLKYRDEGLLFDCGEGTQRQFLFANIKMTKITKIFISHWHGDHVLGIVGLLQTLNNSEYNKKLEIYGPYGTKKKMTGLFKLYDFNLSFDYNIFDIKEGIIVEEKDFKIMAVELDHGIPCFGFSFLENDKRKINMSFIRKKKIPNGPLLGKLQNNKDIEWNGEKISAKKATSLVSGKKISFIMDTILCDGCSTLAKNSNVLICESSFTDEFENKAKEFKHMTAKQAGILAKKNNVKKLVLIHFSQRFKSTNPICDEAKKHHKNTICAEDLFILKI